MPNMPSQVTQVTQQITFVHALPLSTQQLTDCAPLHMPCHAMHPGCPPDLHSCPIMDRSPYNASHVMHSNSQTLVARCRLLHTWQDMLDTEALPDTHR